MGEEYSKEKGFYKDGSCYVPFFDKVRLLSQHNRIFRFMQNGIYRTLAEIRRTTGDPEASISATLRDFRKARFGGHTVNKNRRGNPSDGLFEYQLVLNNAVPKTLLEYENFGNVVKLKERWIPKADWFALNAQLTKNGYEYKGNGVWLK